MKRHSYPLATVKMHIKTTVKKLPSQWKDLLTHDDKDKRLQHSHSPKAPMIEMLRETKSSK